MRNECRSVSWQLRGRTGVARSLGLLGLATVFVALAASVAVAADLQSGPEPGSKVPALKVLASTGDKAGQDIDVVDERKDKVTVYAFVQADQFDRPMARLLKKVDTDLADKGDAAVVAVWLTADVNKSHDYLPKAQQSLQFARTTLAVSRGGKETPPGWNIDIAARCSMVVVRKGKVVARFGWDSVNETEAPPVIKAATTE